MKSFCFALSATITLFTSQAFSSEAGMPQLNPEFWLSQIFWLIIIFSILYLIIWKVFLPNITYSIDNKKSKIYAALNDAKKLNDRAKNQLEEYKLIIDNAKKEARKIIDESKKNLDEDIRNKKQKFNNEIEKELKTIEKEINDLKKSSIKNINNIAIETSSEVIKHLIDTEINKSNVSAIVSEVTKTKIEKYI